jgi:hypothetical protein
VLLAAAYGCPSKGGFTSCGILMSLYRTRHQKRGRAGGRAEPIAASLLLCYNLKCLELSLRLWRLLSPCCGASQSCKHNEPICSCSWSPTLP